MACCVDIGACFVDFRRSEKLREAHVRRGGSTFRVDRKSRSVDGLISNYNIAILIDKNEIRDTYLREVLRERVEPEVICKNWISD